MKITNLRLRELEGTIHYPGTFWEERLRMPTDIYPEFKARTGKDLYTHWGFIHVGKDQHKIRRIFLEIDTDESVSGISGPINWLAPAFYIDTQLKPLLIGQDPLATERLWDIMYRNAIHGRKGDNMHAISYVDVALWDIKGKALGQPVYRLLGGPVQEKIPAYASALGFSIEPERAKERVKEFLKQGYTATKWFVREGPTDGPEGVRKNVELMKALREAAGPDMEIMIDCWSSWDVPYTLKMAELLAEYRPYWFEEPVLADRPESYAQLRAQCPVKIAGGEHEYTRWGAKMLMDLGACDIYQMDPVWAGGISEVNKICTLASVYDVQVIPHGCMPQVNAQVSFAQNVTVVPMMEYLVVLNEMWQHFLKTPLKPINGFFYPPEAPGVGIELDESKIEAERELSWR
ncbi:MAG TPA: mandelate racemase/muconate lactonizing protein [Dehalococcoidia bacterium]|nr:mandelate racemase/muconate lactonizing protein [Dehalococcoidia bacterium]